MAKYREGKGHPGKRGAPIKEHEKLSASKSASRRLSIQKKRKTNGD